MQTDNNIESQRSVATAHAEATTKWTGRHASIGGRLLGSRLRAVIDRLFMGDSRGALLDAASPYLGDGSATVLDVGAGSGYLSLPLAARLRGGRVHCLDLSAEMLELLERQVARRGLGERVELRCHEASDSGLAEGEADLVVSGYALHEMPAAGPALAEMSRVLRSGGAVLILDFKQGHHSADHGPQAHGTYSPAELAEHLRAAGFLQVAVREGRTWMLGSGVK